MAIRPTRRGLLRESELRRRSVYRVAGVIVTLRRGLLSASVRQCEQRPGR